MSYKELRTAVKQVAAQDLAKPGKMYFKDGYIFIIEQMKGIHVIDNSNPSSPQNLSFIEIPGTVDIAIKGQTLYTDSYVDLVALDLSDMTNITEVYRNEGVLPYILPPYDEEYPVAKIDEDKGVVINWEVKKVKQSPEYYYYPMFREMDMMNLASSGAVSSSGIGVGGSMARFGMRDNTLFIVDESNLHIYDITNASSPNMVKTANIGWGIETMFILGDNLFFGTRNGMLIYDISVPVSPMYLSQFWHLTSCDPVVVQDTIAYVTLRGGSNCWNNNVNELDVLSISNLSEPYLLKAYPMVGPYGLGIDGNTLFICDGTAGLKVYDTSDPLAIDEHLIAEFPDIFAYDVIPLNGNLLLIGDDGFYQYSYSNQNIQLLSKIEVIN
jgi:hypothetical protein